MMNYAKYLADKNIIQPPFYYNFILGNIACAQADMLHLGLLIKEVLKNSFWAVGGIGNFQFQMNVMALIAGGGVRVGLEDNIWYDSSRTKLATNVDLIKRILVVSKMLGLEPYKPKELRKILGV